MAVVLLACCFRCLGGLVVLWLCRFVFVFVVGSWFAFGFGVFAVVFTLLSVGTDGLSASLSVCGSMLRFWFI